jgi:rhodanese-related sulfurtransferase
LLAIRRHREFDEDVRIAHVALTNLVHDALAVDVVDIKPEALLERARKADESFVILDVRTPEEFVQGHVPGAINIPHDKLADRIAELMGEKNKDVVLYCRSGRRAVLAADTLKANGFTKLLHLEGDMQQWTEAKRPVEK